MKFVTDLPAFINSKIQLPNESIKEFLDYLGAEKYKSDQGYLAKWVAQKIQWSNEEKALGILKVWAHSSRAEEYTKEKLEELNKMIDDKVIVALKALEGPSVLRKIKDKQLNV